MRSRRQGTWTEQPGHTDEAEPPARQKSLGRKKHGWRAFVQNKTKQKKGWVDVDGWRREGKKHL